MAERLTADISAELRALASQPYLSGGVKPRVLIEAADKLDGLIALLAKAETERDKALTQVAEYEGAICFDTTCLSCAAVLASLFRETERREQVETTLERVRAAVHVADPVDVTDWQRGYRACSARAIGALAGWATGGVAVESAYRAGRDAAPTVDAYEAACRALEKHRQRADRANAAIERVRALLVEWRDQDPAASLDFGDAIAELDDALNGGDR